MGILFISHSSRDNEAAIKIRNWLRTRGWGDVFLDLDPQQGLAPGHRWQQELKKAGERCSGVLILLSPNWTASRWCQTEFLVADQLGKKIFPIFVAPTDVDELPVGLKEQFQIVDISAPETEDDGFERLSIGLKRAGLDPKSFEWPPPRDLHRPIYRGLQSLDEDDAAIFFGRDAAITKGLDALRRMRDGAPERMLVVLGASGAGKSSFLKAGLLARLKRDEENFVALPVIRPERAALSGERGLAASLSRSPADLNGPEDIRSVFTALRESVTERLRRYAESSHETYTAKPPTIVIPIDQAEELFSVENAEGGHFLELLARAVLDDANAIIVATIRSDSFEKLQSEPRLADAPITPFSLPAIPHGVFKDVIEFPARLANPPVVIESELTEQLLEDLAADDALPLLAFTLERLLHHRRGHKSLTLADYTNEFGGLQGAITAAVEEAFSRASRDPELRVSRSELERLARAAFIPALVQIDDADAEPRRRVERLDALPVAARVLVRHLVDQRLLTCDRQTIGGVAADIVEVAHEAILRQWPALKSWIAEERDALRALDGVRVAAAEWRTHMEGENGPSWLVHRGGRLEEAESLAARTEFASGFGNNDLAYLACCRAQDNSERQRERLGIARTTRLQRSVGILIALAALIVVLAGIGIARLLVGIRIQAADMLLARAAQESETGNYDRATRFALASGAAADWSLDEPDARAEAELRGAAAASSVVAILRGHTDMVLGANFSTDGRRIITASRDGTARIWDAATGRQLAILRGHKRPVTSAAFSPDGTLLATASEDGTARIWDWKKARVVTVLRGHEDAIWNVAFSPDGDRVVTASSDHTARTWDVHSGRSLAVFRGHGDAVEGAVFSPDGLHVATGSDDKTARIWDANTGRAIAVLRGHEGFVASIAFTPDGTRIITGSDDRTARVWDANGAREIEVLSGHEKGVTGVCVEPGGMRIATASKDNTVRIWNADNAHEIAVLRGHDDAVNAVACAPDGRRVVSASDDGTARIWDISRATRELRGHDDTTNSASFSPDGKRIVTASNDRTVRLWDAASALQTAVLSGHTDMVEIAAYSPDGLKIVSGSDDRTARIWDARSGRALAVLHGHEGPVYGAAFSPDGKRIVTASTDGTARIWDADTGKSLIVLHGSARVSSANFSPDGRRLVTASSDGSAVIWDAIAGDILLVLRGHEGAVSSASFSPDGTEIVTAGRDRTARTWNASTGRAIAVLRGHDDAVLGAEFSADGARIVTASRDRTVRLWDAKSGFEIAVLRGHEGSVNSADFSPDGKKVATSSDDTTGRIWNVSTLHPMVHSGVVRHVCETTLANGASEFSARDLLHFAPVLDPQLDKDACHPPSLWARFIELLF